jgi:DNA polymerase-1
LLELQTEGTSMTIALIDGDIVAYRCAASCETSDVDLVFYRIDEMMDGILNATRADSFKVYLTGKDNFRKEVYPEYKAHRSKLPKPVWLEDAREYLESEYNAIICDGEEADDQLGINQEIDTVICSIDKDLLQVPGKHYNFVKDAFTLVNEWEGQYHFYKQCLMGDRSDNVKGIYGIGDKKADKILAERNTEQELFDAVRNAYSNDDEFLMNARCLWIRRKPQEDYKEHFERLANGQTKEKGNTNELSESEGSETSTARTGYSTATLSGSGEG